MDWISNADKVAFMKGRSVEIAYIQWNHTLISTAIAYISAASIYLVNDESSSDALHSLEEK